MQPEGSKAVGLCASFVFFPSAGGKPGNNAEPSSVSRKISILLSKRCSEASNELKWIISRQLVAFLFWFLCVRQWGPGSSLGTSSSERWLTLSLSLSDPVCQSLSEIYKSRKQSDEHRAADGVTRRESKDRFDVFLSQRSEHFFIQWQVHYLISLHIVLSYI